MPCAPVQRSLECVAGEKMTPALLSQICWRLAGNTRRLIGGTPVYPWTRQPYPEWVPAQITQWRRRRSPRGKAGYMFSLRIMAGFSAGMIATQFWTDPQCWFLSREFGFVRQRGNDADKPPAKLFHHASEFMSLRMTILVDPTLCKPSEPGFKKTRLGAADLAWNKDILKLRDRLEVGYQAHCQMNSATQCFRCPYGTHSCPAGTHEKDYVFEFCPGCEDSKAAFDKSVNVDLCIKCAERKVMSRKA